MIVANRGVQGRAFAKGEVLQDHEALQSARRLGTRLLELGNVLGL
jgi:hypothetical protein